MSNTFDAHMVAYLKAARTMSQEDVDRVEHERSAYHMSAEEAYEMHAHHAEGGHTS